MTTERRIRATEVLLCGKCSGDTLVLEEALSFWGGLDPKSGDIVDEHHPQQGECVAGKILIMPGTRGSTSSPGALADALQRGMGPAAVILPEPDITILVAVMIARELHNTELPVVVIGRDDYRCLESGQRLTITDANVLVLDETGHASYGI